MTRIPAFQKETGAEPSQSRKAVAAAAFLICRRQSSCSHCTRASSLQICLLHHKKHATKNYWTLRGSRAIWNFFCSTPCCSNLWSHSLKPANPMSMWPPMETCNPQFAATLTVLPMHVVSSLRCAAVVGNRLVCSRRLRPPPQMGQPHCWQGTAHSPLQYSWQNDVRWSEVHTFFAQQSCPLSTVPYMLP